MPPSGRSDPLMVTEWHGGRVVRRWGAGDKGSDARGACSPGRSAWLHDVLAKTFLPEAFPHSVTPDYLGGQVCTTIIQAVNGRAIHVVSWMGLGVMDGRCMLCPCALGAPLPARVLLCSDRLTILPAFLCLPVILSPQGSRCGTRCRPSAPTCAACCPARPS